MNEERERLTPSPARKSRAPLLIIVAVLIVVAGGWYLFSGKEEAPTTEPAATTPAPEPEQEVETRVEAAPDIPAPTPTVETTETPEPEPEPEPLPPLDNSDDYAREQLLATTDDDTVASWLQTDSLVQKSVAVIDGMARGTLLRKVIPIEPPAEKFRVVSENGQLWLDESNFDRYDPVVSTVTAIEPERLAGSFHSLRPLMEEALNQLGSPADSLDNRLIAAIDLMLATPEPSGPIALKRESVYYQFEDPELEALPSIQKQLIRLGPDNQAKVKQYLRQLRAALLAEQTPAP